MNHYGRTALLITWDRQSRFTGQQLPSDDIDDTCQRVLNLNRLAIG
ncbi:hypothetical protein [Brucella pituitosa]|nr:hypothetical protein [Brucella pituitosa]